MAMEILEHRLEFLFENGATVSDWISAVAVGGHVWIAAQWRIQCDWCSVSPTRKTPCDLKEHRSPGRWGYLQLKIVQIFSVSQNLSKHALLVHLFFLL